MSQKTQHLYDFGSFRLDEAERLLLRAGAPVPLTPKAFETLVLLVRKNGRLVEKDELMKALWPDSFVEESNVTNNIWALRKALGDGETGNHYIETVPKRGYRFVAEVRKVAADTDLEQGEETRTIPVGGKSPRETTGAARQVDGLPFPARVRRWLEPYRALLIVAGLACVLVFGWRAAMYRRGVSWDAKRQAIPADTRALPSLAILPFKTLGGGAEDEYVGIGISDALIVKLGGARRMVVRPMSAVHRYARTADPVAAGREQGVDAVLDGTVQRAGERIRVSVQLLRVADGSTIWSAQFDEKFTNVFDVYDSISQRVTPDLTTRISGEAGASLPKQEKTNIEAYKAYLKGRYFWNKRSRDGFRKALELYQQAIDLDPTYAPAYAGLGDAVKYLGGHDLKSQIEAEKRAKAAQFKALELDETLADAHASLGLYAYDVDFTETERQLRRAIELNPNHASAHQWYGEFLAYMGRFDEAITEIQRAHEIDPLSLIISTDVAKIYAIDRQYDRAIELYKATLEMDANFDEARGLLGIAYVFSGQADKAIVELHKIKDLEGRPLNLAFLGYAYAVGGREDEARRVRRRLEDLSRRTYISPYCMSFLDMGLGAKQRVFEELEQMLDGQVSGKATLKVNPLYDSLRSDPRFVNILRRAGFRI